MATRIQTRSIRLVSTALFAAVLWHRGAEAAELNVCIDKSSPAAKMDAQLARAVGHQQGANAHIAWFDGSGDDDGMSSREFRKLADGRCALILGFPVDAQAATLPEGTRATAPYAHTGFVLVTRGHGESTLDRLPKGSTVGVTYLTAPNLYFVDHHGISPQVFSSDAESLHALQHHKVDAAILWRPYAAQHLRDGNAALNMVAVNEPHAAWNLVALYQDAAASNAHEFEQGIDALRRSGELQKLLQPYADAAAAEPVAMIAPTRWSKSMAQQPRLIAVASKKSGAGSKAPPALYTEDQATAGKAEFAGNCSVCHGNNLEGRAGPALKGYGFANPASKFSVSDVFQIVSRNMPAPAPGTLTQQQYVELMAFLLQQNGYPSGSTALTFDGADKSKVKLIYREVQAY